uniref:Large ribosomal subunit protein mL50 n=1 Tax=Strigamia maritima TaxID=126957 RepID=T1IJV2_STRMM
MNSLLAYSFTKLSTITRSFVSPLVRCYATQVGKPPRHTDKYPPKYRMRIYNRRLRNHIRKEKKQYEKEVEESFLPPQQKIEFNLQSLATRGFLRSTKPYTPPNDVSEKILNIARLTIEHKDDNQLINFALTDPDTRFHFLSSCVTELHHDIPNSQLHEMTSVSAVIDYYQLPVSTVNSYDKMCDTPESLPPNLHMQKEPIRFHPETDTMFGGISAFPEHSVIVSGLKSKKKFKGFDGRPPASKLY